MTDDSYDVHPDDSPEERERKANRPMRPYEFLAWAAEQPEMQGHVYRVPVYTSKEPELPEQTSTEEKWGRVAVIAFTVSAIGFGFALLALLYGLVFG